MKYERGNRKYGRRQDPSADLRMTTRSVFSKTMARRVPPSLKLWRGEAGQAPVKRLITDVTGQALIEAVAALGVIIVGVFGALAFLSSSLGLNRLVTDHYVATYLASGLLESYKNCLDGTGWNYDNCKEMALADVNNLAQRGMVNNTAFNFDFDDPECFSSSYPEENKLFICATVSWEEKGSPYTVALEDHFYKWR